MSNATQDSRNSGDNRRRRSRGGQNRNNNQNNEGRRSNSDGERGPRDSRNDHGQGNRRDSNRAEEFRPQAPRPARVYSQPKLSFWQKILKAIGLYKAPAKSARSERESDSAPAAKRDSESRPPKSNVRNARTDEREPREAREPREKRPEGDRPPREPRSRDGARSGDRPRGGDPKSVESTRVYVGNLSYDVSEQDLQELFKGIGGVRNIEVVYNRSTHRSKGYGFVEMLRMDEAIRAVEVLHDQPFMGRKMTVSGAKSKGHDEREEMEERPDHEPRQPVVLASTSPPASAVVELSSPETIVAEEAPLEIAAAEDLESKYGFEPEKKAEEV